MSSQGQNVGISGHNFKRGVIADQAVAIDEDWFNAPIPLFIQSDYTILITFHGALDTSSVLEYTRNGTDYFELNSGEVVNAGQDFHLTIVAVTGDTINIRAKTALEIKYLIVEANYDEALLNFPVAGVSGAASALHDLLSLTHPDTTAAPPQRGAVIRGNNLVKWEKIVGAVGQFLQIDGAGDVIWGASPSQTPWLSDIDGNGFLLQGATDILLRSVTPMLFEQYDNDFAKATKGASGNAMTLSTTSAPRIVVSGGLFTGGINPSTPATATAILSGVVVADSVVVDGLTYAAVTGPKADNSQFSIDGGDAAAAIDLADSITNDPRTGVLGHVNANAVGTTVNMAAAVPFTIGSVAFDAAIAGAGQFNYALLNTVVWDNTPGTAGSEFQIIARYQDTATVFMEVNPVGNSLRSRFFFELNVNGGYLSFSNNVGAKIPPITENYIQAVLGGLEFNTTNNDKFSFQEQTTEILGIAAPNIDFNLNNIINLNYATLVEGLEPSTPAANEATLWLDPSVIINDHPRLALKDENGVVFDLSSAGIIVNTYNTEAIGSNHYLALSGLNGSNATFINRAVVLPRSCRFYNMYVVVTTNGTTVDTTCNLNDADASPTVLEVDIPLGTTGLFFNTDDFVDLEVGTEVAYRFSATTGGTLAVASCGLATDVLRLVN